jgi:hypothetical protein
MNISAMAFSGIARYSIDRVIDGHIRELLDRPKDIPTRSSITTGSMMTPSAMTDDWISDISSAGQAPRVFDQIGGADCIRDGHISDDCVSAMTVSVIGDAAMRLHPRCESLLAIRLPEGRISHHRGSGHRCSSLH